MPKIISRELLSKQKPTAKFAPGLQLKDHMKLSESAQGTLVEFMGTDQFNSQWYARQRYEVEAGREEEPLVYQPIYSEVSSADLPRNVTVYQLGPGGVIFDEIQEGGEVKFATVGESNYSIPIKHYGVGVEYNKDLIMYNELWNLSIIERQAGIAYNALLNHLHLTPIISYSYAAANQTAASSTGSTLAEKWVSTLQDAIVNAKNDTTNPRRGPYVLLIHPADVFKYEAMFARRFQDGIDDRSSALTQIQSIIAYDGWSGVRGKKTVTYTGVTSGKAYLISLQYKNQDFQAFEKQSLTTATGNPDVSRFILEQTVWDFYRGLYANPVRAVEEITWPTS